MKSSKAAVVIPARYGSTRFPAKVLAKLAGKSIIQRVWEKAVASGVEDVIVAVDDERVASVVRDFGGKAVMTSPNHPSGSDRIHEASASLDSDIIINVQGDEPLIPSSVIAELAEIMKKNPALEMATVAVPCLRKEVESNPNIVKLVMTKDNYAMYFSRSMIPYLREGGSETTVYRHWGIYAYRKTTLAKFVSLPEGDYEKCEKLEQLRAMENGIRIYVHVSNLESIGIDTPEDLEKAEKYIAEKGL